MPEPAGGQNWPPRKSIVFFFLEEGVGVFLPRICEPPPPTPCRKLARGGPLVSRSGYNRTYFFFFFIIFFFTKRFPLTGKAHTPSRLRFKDPIFLQRMAFRAELIAAAQVPDAERSGAFREGRGKLWVSRSFLPAGGGATWHGGGARGRREGPVD